MTMGRASGTKIATTGGFAVLGTRRGVARSQDDLPEYERMRTAAMSANGPRYSVEVDDKPTEVRFICKTTPWTGDVDGRMIVLEGELDIDQVTGRWVISAYYGSFGQRYRFSYGGFFQLEEALETLATRMAQLIHGAPRESGEHPAFTPTSADEHSPEFLTPESVACRLDVMSGHTPGGLEGWPRHGRQRESA